MSHGKMTINRRRALFGASALLAATASCVSKRDTSNGHSQWADPPLPLETDSRMAELPGVKLDYWDTGGQGAPVILLHPVSGSNANWGYQQRALSDAGYRVIAYSRRSHGKSESGPPDDPGSGATDLAAFVDLLGITKFHLVGSAAGAFVALDFSVSYPERLLSLTIANSIGGIKEPAWMNDTATLLPSGFRDMPVDFRELCGSYRVANPAGRMRWLELEAESIPGQRVQQPMLNSIGFAELQRISVPTLVITGDADLYMPPARALQLAEHLPNSEIAIVTGAGHSTYWEQPLQFNRKLLSFLGKHTSARNAR